VVGTADLAGAIELNQINISKIQPGSTRTVLVAADGGLSADDIVLAVAPSIVTQYGLEAISATELALTLNTSFVPQDKLNEHLLPNEKRIGTYINDVQLAGSSAELTSTITGLVAATDITTLGGKYQMLNPENYAASAARGAAVRLAVRRGRCSAAKCTTAKRASRRKVSAAGPLCSAAAPSGMRPTRPTATSAT
jgi:hypothetical protein